jgi:mono/diheme cytochrome c family protein
MLVALTGRQELGLALVAGVFICFALVSAFLIPRRWPDFPGRRGLKWFLVLTVLLFASMMTAVAVFARESGEEEAGGNHEGTTTAETQPATTETQPGTTETQPPATAGDPTAGKVVFTSAGCGACHTLADAGTSGTVGPNLDQAKPPYALVIERVTNGKPPMPAFKNQLSEKQIQDVAAYVVQATS